MAAALSASLAGRPAVSHRAGSSASSTGRSAHRWVLARSSNTDRADWLHNAAAVSPAGMVLSVAGLASSAAPARAEEAAAAAAEAVQAVEKAPVPIDAGAIEAALQEAEAAVQAAVATVAGGEAPKQVEAFVEEAAEALKEAAAAVVEEAAASSAAEQAASAASVSAELDQAAASLKQAAQAAQGTADTDVVEAIQSAVAAITDAAATAQELAQPAIAAAEPAVKQAYSFLSTTDPAILAEYALGVVAVGYILPPLAQAGLEAARGYAGDVQPTGVLDALVSQGGNALVDIRSAADKEEAGVPDLADPTKLVELEFVAVEDSKLYSRLRNATEVEAESTAIQIAALKSLDKSMTLYIMDNSGSVARSVAKELAKRGFSRTFVVSGGAQAWIAAKLRTKSWSPAAALLPEKVGAAM
ncbi:hypothetical protein ABPG75_000332 [Micractinium tetrahymenae]